MYKSLVILARSRLGVASLSRRNGSSSVGPKKVGVVLSGSGYLDGSCVHEASAVAVHLSRNGMDPVFYAPSCPQPEVVNHQTGCKMNENRCVMAESARIAKCKLNNLSELQHCDVSGIVFPGGFGSAKTLSTFEKDLADCAINGEVMRVLEEFHDVRKPMAFICISAVLPARMFPCVKVTLGMKGNQQKWPFQYAIDCATQMGAEVEPREVDMFSFDKQHMVFSTPAFMYAGTFAEIYDGIGIMLQNYCKYLE